MSSDNSATKIDEKMQSEDSSMASESALKGKGKAVEEPQDMSMDDDESSEESAAEDHAESEEEDEDNMEAIDPDNILDTGRRTRGKEIDFAKAAQDDTAADEDDDDDEDFVEDEDAMEQ
ncbi:Histone H2A.Z-specific chaperone CHZ1 [Coniosporium apollinis]|uniref:Histone H2A.Z-specific chaperone CHZ1 n=2 Tax=Coniosporium TaxID=2810619 RepID=A0ABQ9NWK6_9PEZI|nr:Histone H2A.Z-specific chaperone CHZ1 [Cladosporium sp. JES 115]KAJ9666071.1 Histone H2A.Z-specific chaperone CHZ1 [Coniosporium apollinis]